MKNLTEILTEIETGSKVYLNQQTSVRKITLSNGHFYYETFTIGKSDSDETWKNNRHKEYTDYNKFKNAVKRYIKKS
tara:strand:+ start:335 stop:565 length:231 start_codon:yes stop_codon:yes gene_type:complete